MIEFSCHACDQRIESDDDLAGRSVSCPSCSSVLWIPQARPPILPAVRIESAAPWAIASTARHHGLSYFAIQGGLGLISIAAILAGVVSVSAFCLFIAAPLVRFKMKIKILSLVLLFAGLLESQAQSRVIRARPSAPRVSAPSRVIPARAPAYRQTAPIPSRSRYAAPPRGAVTGYREVTYSRRIAPGVWRSSTYLQ